LDGNSTFGKIRQVAFSGFDTIYITMTIHYKNMHNYFGTRSTNASTKSFDARIMAFGAQFIGVRSLYFFLFRLPTIFAQN